MQAETTAKCDRCPKPSAGVCCSAHGKELCHEDYRLTHFVEVCGCRECVAEGLPRILQRSQPNPAPVVDRITPTVDAIRARWIDNKESWSQGTGRARQDVTTLLARLGAVEVELDSARNELLLVCETGEAALNNALARLAAYERLEAAARAWVAHRSGDDPYGPLTAESIVGFMLVTTELSDAVAALPAPEVTP